MKDDDDDDHDDKPNKLPALRERPQNPFAIFRQRNSTGSMLFRGDLVKCNHTNGEWFRERGGNKTQIGANERFIIDPIEMIDTWTKYLGGERVARLVFRTVDNEFAPSREALGDTDENCWELERGGKRRRDPWSRAVLLPMRAMSDGATVTFKATGQGAIEEIAEVAYEFARADRGGKLPVIKPEARNFENQHGSTIWVPLFTMVGWQFWDGEEQAKLTKPDD